MSAMRCPVCRAAVQSGPQCRRCKADLSLLLAFRAGLRRRAVEALLRRDFAEAWRAYRVLSTEY
jgi:hypothetical protein